MEAALQPDPAPLEPYLPRTIGGGEPLDRERLLAAPLRSAPRPEILDAPVTELRVYRPPGDPTQPRAFNLPEPP